MKFFTHYIASNSNYPHLLSQGLFKGCPAHLSYLDTESWCLVYAYIILKATDPNIKFCSLQEHHEGGGSTSYLFPLPRSATRFYAEENIPLVF